MENVLVAVLLSVDLTFIYSNPLTKSFLELQMMNYV